MHANSRYEASFWTVNVVGAPLGGLLVSALGAPASMAANALAYLASAAGIRRIRRPEPEPPALVSTGWLRDVTSGWRYIWAAPDLRLLLLHGTLFSSFLMATAPITSVLMLRDRASPHGSTA